MNLYLEKTAREIGKNREEVIDRLVRFALTDMMLFWGQNEDLVKRQEKIWGPLLEWANEEINTKFIRTQSLDVPEQEKTSGYRLKAFLEKLSDKELAAFYVAALNMKSVLLAAALVKGRIDAKQAFEAAYLEELWQAENWGVEEEAEKRRAEVRQELVEIEKFFSIVLFNYLFCNGDAHLKNFSVIQGSAGDYKLAPAYDLMNTRLHLKDRTFAPTKGLLADRQLSFVQRADFLEFAERIECNLKSAHTILEKFTSKESESATAELVDNSFLSPRLKQNYKELFFERLETLS